MALSINQNIMAMNSYRNLTVTQGGLGKSLEKLSSGFRINRAADDAAGLGISEGLRAQVGGNKQAVRNAQDGISLVQTAEGALNEVHAMLQRMRTLAVQGANDSNSDKNRESINSELNQLTDEIKRISSVTEFNGAKLLNNAGNALHFQVGANSTVDNVIDVKTADITTVVAALNGKGLGAEGTSQNPAVAGEVTYAYTKQTGASSFSIGSVKVDLDGNEADLSAVADKANAALTAAHIDGITVAADGTTGLKITGKADGSAVPTIAGTGVGKQTVVTKASVEAKGPNSNDQYRQLIEVLDNQITDVSMLRGEFGAVQNRFEHTINNLNVAVENLAASESRIRDTDMAAEMMQFTRGQILSQAGTAMLAQANQVPQSVLSLLR